MKPVPLVCVWVCVRERGGGRTDSVYVLHCAPSCSQSVDVLSCFEKLDARASVCATGPVLCTKQEDTVKAIPRCGVAGACCILKSGNGILCQQYAFAI